MTFPLRQISDHNEPLTTLVTVINATNNSNTTLVVLLNVTTGPSDAASISVTNNSLADGDPAVFNLRNKETTGYIQRIVTTVKRKLPPWQTDEPLRDHEVPITVSLLLVTTPNIPAANSSNVLSPTPPATFVRDAEKPDTGSVAAGASAVTNKQTAVTDNVRHLAETPPPPETSGNGMLIGIIVAVALLFLFCIIFAIWRKKRNG